MTSTAMVMLTKIISTMFDSSDLFEKDFEINNKFERHESSVYFPLFML